MQKQREDVQISRLKPAKHNPPNRVFRANLKSLMESMEKIGLLHPVTVSTDYEIIDGHRRVAAAKALEWKTIEVNVLSNVNNNEIFGSINLTCRKLMGTDALYVWLETPEAVVPAAQKQFAEMTKSLGRPLVKRLCKAGFSRQAFLMARRIAIYCESNDNKTLQDIVEWMLTFPVSGQIKKAIEAGESPKVILNAVRSGKPVKMKLSIS